MTGICDRLHSAGITGNPNGRRRDGLLKKRRRAMLIISGLNVAVLIVTVIVCCITVRGGKIAEKVSAPAGVSVIGASSWAEEAGAQLLEGIWIGAVWPAGLCSRGIELGKGGPNFESADAVECFRYVVFPYSSSQLSLWHLLGVALAVALIGCLLCFAGIRIGMSWLAYIGFAYFLYLVNFIFFFL